MLCHQALLPFDGAKVRRFPATSKFTFLFLPDFMRQSRHLATNGAKTALYSSQNDGIPTDFCHTAAMPIHLVTIVSSPTGFRFNY